MRRRRRRRQLRARLRHEIALAGRPHSTAAAAGRYEPSPRPPPPPPPRRMLLRQERHEKRHPRGGGRGREGGSAGSARRRRRRRAVSGRRAVSPPCAPVLVARSSRRSLLRMINGNLSHAMSYLTGAETQVGGAGHRHEGEQEHSTGLHLEGLAASRLFVSLRSSYFSDFSLHLKPYSVCSFVFCYERLSIVMNGKC